MNEDAMFVVFILVSFFWVGFQVGRIRRKVFLEIREFVEIRNISPDQPGEKFEEVE